MIHRRGGNFHVAVQDLRTRQVRVLTQGGLEESPSLHLMGK